MTRSLSNILTCLEEDMRLYRKTNDDSWSQDEVYKQMERQARRIRQMIAAVRAREHADETRALATPTHARIMFSLARIMFSLGLEDIRITGTVPENPDTGGEHITVWEKNGLYSMQITGPADGKLMDGYENLTLSEVRDQIVREM